MLRYVRDKHAEECNADLLRRAMRVFHGFEHLPHFVHPAVTVGSYDGVHRGHRALIERLVAEARAQGGESIVLTFEPHPRITLGRAEGLQLLTTLEEKVALLAGFGIVWFGRNLYEKTQKECVSVKSGIAVVLLLVLSTLSFSGVSTYVYANF